jgi:hypothetical protein
LIDLAIDMMEAEVDWARLDRVWRLLPIECIEAFISDIDLNVSSTDSASSMTPAERA